MIQLLIVILVLAGSVLYVGWWVYQRLQKANDPCEGCDGCQLKELKEHAKQCKKQKKSSCCTKK